MAKVTINQEECISCGACWSECPEFFEESDNRLSQVVEKYRIGGNPAEGEAPPELENCVKSAAQGCPVEAIKVE